jgi:DNA-binding CsgD family transcriptional regulator
MGEGRSGREIADSLNLGASTITFHKHNIMRMLGIESEAGLLRYAVLLRAGIPDK